MSDEITVAGNTYVSSKRAAKISGYAQDYIGQLARSGQIEAQRIGGLWYVSMASLQGYRKDPSAEPQKEIEKLEQNDTLPLSVSDDVESFISFDGKDYISASRASKLTAYNQDYVGQLARSGQVLARQISSRWYIDRESIIKHKEQKDSLLAAVQAASVGLPEPEPTKLPDLGPLSKDPELTYFKDESDLLPKIAKKEEESAHDVFNAAHRESTYIPIRLVKGSAIAHDSSEAEELEPKPKNRRRYAQTGVLAASALTVVIVLSFGVASLRANSTYVFKNLPASSAFTASAGYVFDQVGNSLESVLSPELVFSRD